MDEQHLLKNYISSRDAARLYGVTNDYVARLCRKGKISGVLQERIWLVEKSSLQSFFDTKGRTALSLPTSSKVYWLPGEYVATQSAAAPAPTPAPQPKQTFAEMLFVRKELVPVLVGFLFVASSALGHAVMPVPQSVMASPAVTQSPFFSAGLSELWSKFVALLAPKATDIATFVPVSNQTPTTAAALPTPSSTQGAGALAAPQTIIQNTYPVIERTVVETVRETASGTQNLSTYITYDFLSDQLEKVFDAISEKSSSGGGITDFSTLTLSDIPDLSSLYLSLDGGTVTGHVTLLSATTTATSTLAGLALDDLDCSAFNNGGTLTTDSSGNVICANDDSTAGSGSPGGLNTYVQYNDAGSFGGDSGFTYNASADRLTVSFASSTGISAGYASTTRLVAGTASIESLSVPTLTVGSLTGVLKASSGVVSTAVAGTDYVANTTGDWTGTLDGQEGSYYLDARNLSNFGVPFYTLFAATTTSALSEGSNLYYTLTRFATALAGTTTTALAEGSNLYYTSARATANFVSNLAATTSVSSITTLPNLSLPYSQVSGTPTLFAYPFPSNATSTSIAFNAGLTAPSATITYASTTGISTGYASTTNLVVSGVSSGLLKTVNGVVSAAVAGTDYLTSTFAYPFPSNATTTSIAFNSGLTASSATITYASSTAVTVSGVASTTNLVVSGIASGSTQCLQINSSGTVSGTGSACGSGSGGVSAIGPAGQTQSGSTITFATSTSGSDFTITASGDSITFNLPIASASNTGKLSATDWTMFNAKLGSTSIDTSAELAGLLTDETGSGALVFGTNATLSSTTLTGNTVMANATTSTFAITNISGSLLKTLASGAVVPAVAGTDYLTSTFAYPFPSNATSTSIAFNAGLTAYASSTIGGGTQTTGLTISGGATTTGTLVVQGTGTSTFAGDMLVSGSIVPSANNTYYLGTADKVWHSIFLGPGSLYVNGQKVISTNGSDDVVVSTDPGENLVLQTSGSSNIEINPTGGQVQIKNTLVMTAGKSITTTDLSALSVPSGVAAGNITVSGNAITATNTNGDIALTPNGNGDTYITTGRLGIGTTNPTSKLVVVGQTTGEYFTATSTTLASTFPYASTTALSATAVCLSTDCRTSWPSAGSSFAYPFQGNATTSVITFSDGLLAGSTTIGTLNATSSATLASTTLSGNTLLANATTTNFAITGLASALLATNSSGSVVATTSLSASQYFVQASASANGYLSSTDWSQFNAKLGSTSIDTSAELATLVGDEVGIGSLVFDSNATLSSTTLAGNTLLSYASTTAITVSGNFYGAGLSACSSSSDKLLWSNGQFSCGTDQSGGGGGTDVNWTFFNNSGIRLATTTNQVLIGATATSSLISVLAKLGVVGGASIDYASTTMLTAETASTTNLVVSGISNSLLKTVDGVVTAAVAGVDYQAAGNYSTFAYPFPSNATSTTITFGGGIMTGTSTIGALNATSTVTLSNYTSGALAVTSTGSLYTYSTSTWSFASSTLLSDSNTFSGNNTFSNTITGSISGNAGTVTNGVYTTTFNSLFDARFITQLAATSSVSSITTLPNLSLPYSQLTGTPTLFTYPFPNNATTSVITFSNGALFGSTTIGTLNATSSATLASTTLSGNTLIANATTSTFAITGVTGSLLSTNALGSVVATSSVSTNYLTGTLGVANGGTGSTTLGGLLSGNGTSIYSSATGTVAASNGITVTLGQAIIGSGLTITGTNAAADGSTKGVASFTAADFDASSGNISLDYTNGQAASASLKGFLTSADWTMFNAKLGSTSIDTSAELAALLTDETGSGALVFGTSATLSSTTLTGNTVLANATTSTFAITGISGSLLKTLSSGAVVAATAGVDYQVAGNYSTFSYPFPSNATSTTITFGGGIMTGTSTIGALNATSSATLASTTLSGNTLIANATTTNLAITGAAGSLLSTNALGSVVATSSVSTNYLTGTLGVANGGTGSTTLSGILVGNGTSMVQTATISGPLTFSGTTLGIQAANGSQNGYLSSTDWTMFNAKLGSTSIDTSAELAALLTDETGSGALVFGTSATLSSTTLTGNTVLANATSTTFAITGITGSLLKTLSSGAVVAATAGVDYQAAGNYSTFAYPFPSNATSTMLTFGNGLLSTASSTIVDGLSSLHVSSSAGITANYNGYELFLGANSHLMLAGAAPYVESTDQDSVLNLRSTGASGAVILSTNGVERLRADGSGNIGIGTTSPYAKLSVVGQAVAAYFTATTSAASTFPYASTTMLTATTASTTNLTVSSAAGGVLVTDNNGRVSASTTVAVNVGGTGSTTLSGILVGSGTSMVQTLVVGSGLTFDGTTLATSGSGITAIGPAGQTQTGGTQTLATSTNGTDFTITASTNTITFNLPVSSASASGKLSATDWTMFNAKLGSTSIDTSAELAALVTDETGSGALVFGTSATLSSTTLTGNTVLANATTTTFAITGISGSLLKTLSSGAVVAATAGVDYQAAGNYSTFSYPFPNNATSTTITFGGGIMTGTSTVGTLHATSTVTLSNYTSGALAVTSTGSLYTYSTSTWSFASSTLLSDSNTFSGNNTFSNTITGSISGNAGTVTNGVYTTTFNSLFDARFITQLAATSSVSSITTLPNLSLPYSQLTGTPTLFTYPFPNNATTTVITFSAGTLMGSSTIGTLNATSSATLASTTLSGNTLIANATTSTFAITGVTGSLLSTNALGSVVATSSVSTNYLTGTLGVANGGTGSTTLSGILVGNGTSMVQTATVSSPLSFSGTTLSIQNAAADGSTKGVASFTAADFDASSGNISLDYTNGQAASGSNKGFLTSADWSTFNNKISSTSLSAGSGISYNSSTGVITNTIGYPFVGNATTTVINFSAGTLMGSSTIGTLNATSSATLASTTLAGNTLIGNATSTNFAITGVTGSLLKTLSSGAVVAAVAGVDYQAAGNYSTFSYPFPNNATSTTITFGGGIMTGTSTIGALNATSTVTLSNYTSGALAVTSTGSLYTYSTSTWSFASSTLLSDSNTFSGNNTFSNTITGSISGNAGTVTNGVYTTTFNSLFDARFITQLAATSSVSSITTLPNLSLPYSQLSGAPVIAAYPFGGTGNSTSTLTQFNGGLTSYASTTIGAGATTTGLTISGGATTTGTAYFASNVGVGVSSPAVKLQVHDPDNTFARLSVTNSSSGSNALSDGLVIESNAGDSYIWNRESGFMSFGTNNTERLVISSTGNVGIGTSTPGAKLSVNGDAILSGRVTGQYFAATSTASASVFPYASTTAITTSHASTTALIVSGLNSASCDVKADTNGVLSCGTDSTGSGGAYPFGGTGNSTSTLTQFNGGLTAFASTTIGAGGQATGLTISGGATTTGNAYFGGNVGIGTVSPNKALEVVSTDGLATILARNTDSSSFAQFVATNDQNSASTRAAVFGYAGSAATNVINGGLTGEQGFQGTVGAYPFTFYTNNTARITVAANANKVGIGTSTNLTAGGTLNLATSNGTDALDIINTGSSNKAYALYPNGNDLRLYEYSGPVGSSGSDRLTIQAGGNVGIGTTTPGAKLSVNGDAILSGRVTGQYFIATSTANASVFPYASTTAVTVSGTASTTDLVVSSLGSGAGNCLTTNSSGVISTQACGGSSFGYPFPSNATSTLITFSGGLSVGGTLSVTGGRVDYTAIATSTIVNNAPYAWTLATSTTAKPLIAVTTTTGAEEIAIGHSGYGDVIIGAVGNATNLVFEESSTIHGQGANTLTFGQAGDKINFAVNTGFGTTTANARISAEVTGASDTGILSLGRNASYAGSIYGAASTRAASSAYYFFSAISGYEGTTDNEFLLRGDGNGFMDGSWTSPADFAEWTRVVGTTTDYQVGDLVGFATSTEGGTSDRRAALGIKGSTPLGVITLKPGMVGVSFDLSDDVTDAATGSTTALVKNPARTQRDMEEAYNAKMIAMVGYTPIHVSTENGPLKSGDGITFSSIPGVGMKAGPGDLIVGYAFEEFDPEEGKMGTHNKNLPTYDDSTTFRPMTTETTTPEGDEVWHGWVFAHVDKGYVPALSLNDMLASTTEDMPEDVRQEIDGFWSGVFKKIAAWMGEAGNGIANLFAATVTAETINAKTLCLEDVCITRDQLQSLLNNAGTSSVPPPEPEPEPEPVGTSTPPTTEEPAPEPTEGSEEPEPAPEETQPEPAPEPEPTPEPEPEPQPEPEPASEPVADEPATE